MAIHYFETSKLVTLTSNEGTNINGQHTRVMWGGETANLFINTTGTGWKKASGLTIPMICEMHNSALQTIPAYVGASTKVNLDTVDIDNVAGGGTAVMADTTNHVCKIVRPSTYTVLGQMGWNQMGASQDVLGTTGKNGNGDAESCRASRDESAREAASTLKRSSRTITSVLLMTPTKWM